MTGRLVWDIVGAGAWLTGAVVVGAVVVVTGAVVVGAVVVSAVVVTGAVVVGLGAVVGLVVVTLEGVTSVAIDLHEGFRHGLVGHLDHATLVADPFHVVAAANRRVDQVRRRVQNEILGHRGRRDDPLYRIRRILLCAHERLSDSGRRRMDVSLGGGDPKDEVLGAWLAKEAVRSIYLTDDPTEAAILVDVAITECADSEVPEVVSLGKTLAGWRDEILAHHTTGASNGPTKGLNLLVKRLKRTGHGFRSFKNYRLRLLLHCGVSWQTAPTARMRGRSPRLAA